MYTARRTFFSRARVLLGLCVLGSCWTWTVPALAQTRLFTLSSPNERESGFFGYVITSVPDLDGDETEDLLIGAPGEEVDQGTFGAGRAYVFSGAAGVLLHQLISPNPIGGGKQEGGTFGSALAGVPDADGDGFGDLLVGAREETSGASPEKAGRAYLFSGRTGDLLFEILSPNEEERGDFGSTVLGLEDIDGDGRGDFVVGARFEDPGDAPTNAGRAYVFSGATGTLLYTIVSPNEESRGNFGSEMTAGPDFDSDGVNDLLVSAYREDPGNSPFNAGRAYIFSGATGAHLHTFRSPNEENNGRFGRSLATVPDITGDGFKDIFIGARWEDPGNSPEQAGRAYVYDGRTYELLHELSSPNAQESGLFAHYCSGTPDVDGDGFGDLLVGALHENPGLSPYKAGRAYMFSGATGDLLYELVSPSEKRSGLYGNEVEGLPDFDGDGYGDFMVAARKEQTGASPRAAGRVHVYSGRPRSPFSTDSVAVSVRPVDGPIVMGPDGGSFLYSTIVRNITVVPRTFDIWVTALMPDSTTFVVEEPRTVTMQGPASQQRTLEAELFDFAPPGVYVFSFNAGRYPDAIAASDSFLVEKRDTLAVAHRGLPLGAPPLASTGRDFFSDLWTAGVAAEAAVVAASAAGGGAGARLYPNPARDRVTLAFSLAAPSAVTFGLHDALGRRVAEVEVGHLGAGPQQLPLDLSGLPSGVYVWRLTSAAGVETGRLTRVE
jgi:hypothetical protein